jgi:hypothetical protein
MIVYDLLRRDGSVVAVTPCVVTAQVWFFAGRPAIRWRNRYWPASQPHAPAAATADTEPADKP